jgi:hypothetical protein
MCCVRCVLCQVVTTLFATLMGSFAIGQAAPNLQLFVSVGSVSGAHTGFLHG